MSTGQWSNFLRNDQSCANVCAAAHSNDESLKTYYSECRPCGVVSAAKKTGISIACYRAFFRQQPGFGMELPAEERLSALRARLEKARGDNLQEVEEENRVRTAVPRKPPRKKRVRSKLTEDKELDARTHNSLVERHDEEDENDDPVVRSINKRAAKLAQQTADGNPNPQVHTVVYGGTSEKLREENVERLVEDAKETDERRAKFRRRRAFVEDKTDISFINEGNRNFNRILEKHYDGYQSVRKIKDSLERGTALP